MRKLKFGIKHGFNAQELLKEISGKVSGETQAQAKANIMNESIGLTWEEAILIILGTMRPGGTAHEY